MVDNNSEVREKIYDLIEDVGECGSILKELSEIFWNDYLRLKHIPNCHYLLNVYNHLAAAHTEYIKKN